MSIIIGLSQQRKSKLQTVRRTVHGSKSTNGRRTFRHRFFLLKCLPEPLQEIFSRQACPELRRRNAKSAKKKTSTCFSKLGVLCAFAGVISLPILHIPTHHTSAPGTRRQCFDVAYDVDDRRSIRSEGLLQRAP